jgi:hypothetical protein
MGHVLMVWIQCAATLSVSADETVWTCKLMKRVEIKDGDGYNDVKTLLEHAGDVVTVDLAVFSSGFWIKIQHRAQILGEVPSRFAWQPEQLDHHPPWENPEPHCRSHGRAVRSWLHSDNPERNSLPVVGVCVLYKKASVAAVELEVYCYQRIVKRYICKTAQGILLTNTCHASSGYATNYQGF